MNLKRKNITKGEGALADEAQPKRQRKLPKKEKTPKKSASNKRNRPKKDGIESGLMKVCLPVHKKPRGRQATSEIESTTSLRVKKESVDDIPTPCRQENGIPFSTNMSLEEFVKQEPQDEVTVGNSQSTFDDFTVHSHPDIESNRADSNVAGKGESEKSPEKSHSEINLSLSDALARAEKLACPEAVGVADKIEIDLETGACVTVKEEPEFAVPGIPVRKTKSKIRKPSTNSSTPEKKKKSKKRKSLKADPNSSSPSKEKKKADEGTSSCSSKEEADTGSEGQQEASTENQTKPTPKSKRPSSHTKPKKAKIKTGRTTFNSGGAKKPGLSYGRTRRKKTDKPPKPRDPGSILEDQRLAKHACVLWSSENRRYYQQLEPSASLEHVEASMARAWDELADREKVRYYQRASSALSDLNRTGCKKAHVAKHGADKPTKRQHRPDTETAMRKFCDLTDMEQKQTLWDRMLRLQGMMTRQSYRRFVTDFLRSFRTTVTTLRQRNDVNADNWKATMEGTFRRLLFGKILQEAPLVDAHVEHRKFVFQKEVRQNFDRIVTRLIAGKRVCFDPRVRSTSMDLLLQDLEEASFYTELNMESLVMELLQEIPDESTSSTKSGKNVEDLISTSPLDCYRLIPISTSMPKALWNDNHVEFNIAGEKIPVPLPTFERSESELLRDSTSSKTLAVFSGDEVKKCFEMAEQWPEGSLMSTEVDPKQQMVDNMYDSWYRMNHGLQQCCPLDAPSCILSDALVLDKLRKADMRQKYQNAMRVCNPVTATPNNDIKSLNIIPVNKPPVLVGQPSLVQVQNLNPIRKPAQCVTTTVMPPLRPAIQELIPIRMQNDKAPQNNNANMFPKVTKILIPSSSAGKPLQPGNIQPKRSAGTTLTFHTVRLSGPARPASSAPGLSILNPVPLSSANVCVQKPVTPHITVMVRKPGNPISTLTEVQKTTASVTTVPVDNPGVSVASSTSGNTGKSDSNPGISSDAS